tara:strand:- start:24 stop:260 length:237 start_codon:yes stop_codon:yes gene_type:complete
MHLKTKHNFSGRLQSFKKNYKENNRQQSVKRLRQKIEAIDEPVSQKYPNYQNDPNAMKRAKEQKSKRANIPYNSTTKY